MTTRRELREDLQASVAARRELGPEYEAELLDAFLERVDRRIDGHVAHRVGSRSLQPPGVNPASPRPRSHSDRWASASR
ncbi:MAG: hypothetical protein M3P91_11060 [Actinomycetota bacterium]|nr:hypothetical protein [Actinomycetota bacterium]